MGWKWLTWLAIILVLLIQVGDGEAAGDIQKVDQDFMRVLAGKTPGLTYDQPELWKQKLTEILSTAHAHPRASVMPALTLVDGLPASVTEDLETLYHVYSKFRKENPTSKWFIETRLPQLIKQTAEGLRSGRDELPPEVCGPPGGSYLSGKHIARLLDAAGQQLIESQPRSIEATQDRYRPVSENRSRDWSGIVAAAYTKKLYNSGNYTNNPQIIPREDAGLKPPRAKINKWTTPTVLSKVVFHHSVTAEIPFTPATQTTVARSGASVIQKMHFDRNWADIGYHFAIDAQGNIFQGRSLNHRGAHAGTEEGNADTIGVVFIGNFDPFDPVGNPAGPKDEVAMSPTPAALQAALSLIAGLNNSNADLHQLSDKDEGLRIRIESVVGHRHYKKTACPGKGCIATVDQLNQILKDEIKKAPSQRRDNQ